MLSEHMTIKDGCNLANRPIGITTLKSFIYDKGLFLQGSDRGTASRIGHSKLSSGYIFFKGAQVGGRTWDLFVIFVYFLSQAAP